MIFYWLGLKQGALSLFFLPPPSAVFSAPSPPPPSLVFLTLSSPPHTFLFRDHHRLDKGEVAEFDHPHVLLQKQGGTFAKLVDELGESSAASLKATAMETFGKRKEL